MEWQNKIQFWYRRLLRSIGQCDLCGNDLCNDDDTQQTLLCSHCLADLPLFTLTIIQGDLLNWPATKKALPNIHFDHLLCLTPYLVPFTQWLPQFKYHGRFELSSFFANLLVQQWQKQDAPTFKSSVDLVLSVPLHISKWQKRGYNQAHLIAQPFAQRLKLPYDKNALRRIIKNKSQVGQTGSQRRNNLANAFTLTKTLPTSVKHVVLIDDVLTTGSTASEISKMLKQAGVNKVTVVTLCLTLPS